LPKNPVKVALQR